MSRRMIATTVGVLFVVQMATAMAGTALIQAFTDGDTGRSQPTAGVLLMMTSGVAVVGIGLLMYPVLKGVHKGLAFFTSPSSTPADAEPLVGVSSGVLPHV